MTTRHLGRLFCVLVFCLTFTMGAVRQARAQTAVPYIVEGNGQMAFAFFFHEQRAVVLVEETGRTSLVRVADDGTFGPAFDGKHGRIAPNGSIHWPNNKWLSAGEGEAAIAIYFNQSQPEQVCVIRLIRGNRIQFIDEHHATATSSNVRLEEGRVIVDVPAWELTARFEPGGHVAWPNGFWTSDPAGRRGPLGQ